MKRLKDISIRLFLLLLVLLLLFLSTDTTEARLFGSTNENDLYALLGVEREATRDEIKKAFRKVTRKHHPDVQETQEAKEAAKVHMVKVLRAYKVLSDTIERQNYDNFGKTFDEDFNARDFTPEEIFARFQQQAPIVSNSLQLESLGMLRRILNFRGNRIFLLQIYDDVCNSCHQFKEPWEILFKSNLVEGGVLQMMRIDAYSTEGLLLLKALNITYKDEVQVFAIVDGKMWMMPLLKAALQSRNKARSAFSALMEFVMNFVHDKSTEIQSLKMGNSTDTILNWLMEERGETNIVRILLPPLMGETIGLTLALLHEDVALVRVAPRQVLLDFVEGYCEQPVEVRNRDGEIVPFPEFIVVSAEQLPHITNTTSMSVKEQQETRSCRGIHIGASATLTYRKASTFVKELMPPRHVGMSNMAYVTSMSLYEVCQQHCLLWLRNNCQEAPNDAWISALKNDYKPFKVGYICLDVETALRESLPIIADNTLVAIVDGDENTLYFLPDKPELKMIAETLSFLLTEGGGENYSFSLSTPLSQLMVSRLFYMSRQQYWYLSFQNLYGLVYPFFSGVYPFLMMFILHKILKRFNLLDDNSDNTNNNNNSVNGANSTGEGSTGTNESSNTTRENNTTDVNRTSAYEQKVLPYSAADLELAKTGKGFLIFLCSHSNATTPMVPHVANDSRFVVRFVSLTDPFWGPWLSQHIQQNEGEKPLTNDSEVTAVAIRQGKMKAAVKPQHTSLDVWLCELLDGTVTANLLLPQV